MSCFDLQRKSREKAEKTEKTEFKADFQESLNIELKPDPEENSRESREKQRFHFDFSASFFPYFSRFFNEKQRKQSIFYILKNYKEKYSKIEDL